MKNKLIGLVSVLITPLVCLPSMAGTPSPMGLINKLLNQAMIQPSTKDGEKEVRKEATFSGLTNEGEKCQLSIKSKKENSPAANSVSYEIAIKQLSKTDRKKNKLSGPSNDNSLADCQSNFRASINTGKNIVSPQQKSEEIIGGNQFFYSINDQSHVFHQTYSEMRITEQNDGRIFVKCRNKQSVSDAPPTKSLSKKLLNRLSNSIAEAHLEECYLDLPFTKMSPTKINQSRHASGSN